MLKFISFGSGSSGNCYYLGTATDGLLIDIGVGIRTLKKNARDYGERSLSPMTTQTTSSLWDRSVMTIMFRYMPQKRFMME